MTIQEIQLNAVRAYIAWVRDLYPNEEDGAARLILVLQIYEWQLRRYKNLKPVNPDQMATLKHGIRTAELILDDIWENQQEMMQGWYLGCTPQNEAQRLANLLWQITLEFTKEIQANEQFYPALKPMFDKERVEYRKMLDDVREADRID
ncbi:hypothetical protein [Tunturiibacter gelidiferens]|uniref:hypothetical protein n=1 Tax=Tunturiibacter gelidiferens TaxID=3069689 RepID=UPI003D9B9097